MNNYHYYFYNYCTAILETLGEDDKVAIKHLVDDITITINDKGILMAELFCAMELPDMDHAGCNLIVWLHISADVI
jgi:hypothetical protein